MNQETKQFITEHEKDNIFALKLQHRNNSEIDIDLAIRQITGRQKTKSKVPLFYNNDDILYPVQLSLEQSSSELTAKYKSNLCNGNTLVDLTGGFGVDCCFMSEHFKQVTYVERQAELCELAEHNFKALDKNHIRVVHAETEKHLQEMEPVDWIFIDPARRSSSGKKVVLLSDCEPDVSALSTVLLEKSNQVMIKLSPMMDITAALRELPTTSEIHIISIENECKEVLLILGQSVRNNKKMSTINFGKNNVNQIFEYFIDDELNAIASFTSTIDKYLYEPNAAVMKSGAFKLVGVRFNLRKLHKNTHLYTSNELSPDFPGRIFETQHLWGNSKAELKELAQHLPKANITTRNYPISVDELRKKLKIKDGGDSYLFACTISNEQKIIIECKKAI
jgi:16S rRNA G966 N2-methylase RsmD